MSEREELAEVEYEMRVFAFGLDEPAVEALFDRVADAAHALDESVMCSASLSPTNDERTFTPTELRAHDDHIRAEAWDEGYEAHDWTEINPYRHPGPALRVAAGTPTHHTTEEDTP